MSYRLKSFGSLLLVGLLLSSPPAVQAAAPNCKAGCDYDGQHYEHGDVRTEENEWSSSTYRCYCGNWAPTGIRNYADLCGNRTLSSSQSWTYYADLIIEVQKVCVA